MAGNNTFVADESTLSSENVSIKSSNSLWISGGSDNILISSDERIKTNIVDVSDDLALDQIRSIPVHYFNFKDKLSSGNKQMIGFIAQEVKNIFPMAVSEQTHIIPSVLKMINCSWNNIGDDFIMSSTDLTNVSGVKYKFYVSNDSDGSNEKELIITGNNDNTFTFDQQYSQVFCYGNEVNDFHTLDQLKLFTLNFSATQELDRIQQKQQVEIDTLKSENAELKSIIDKLKTATSFEDFKSQL